MERGYHFRTERTQRTRGIVATELLWLIPSLFFAADAGENERVGLMADATVLIPPLLHLLSLFFRLPRISLTLVARRCIFEPEIEIRNGGLKDKKIFRFGG